MSTYWADTKEQEESERKNRLEQRWTLIIVGVLMGYVLIQVARTFWRWNW